jgi:hypothetical protein
MWLRILAQAPARSFAPMPARRRYLTDWGRSAPRAAAIDLRASNIAERQAELR